MRVLIKLIRLYTPFICTIMALLNGVLFLNGLTELPTIHLMATLTGNSVLIDVYMLTASLRMCIWYKINVVCLLFIQICGLMYNYCDMDLSLYAWVVILVSMAGILSFLVFRILHRVMRLSCHKYS